MRYRILPVKNISRIKDAGDALISRSMGMPGMGLIWGPTGYGKTTAATWFINQCHGVYIRAIRLWSPRSMLDAMMRELDLYGKGMNNGQRVEAIIQGLAETGRPLFIDEADYVIDSQRLVDTLRDIHDLSSVPVILISMQGICKKLNRRGMEQFTGRIAQWVEFSGADMEDTQLLADGLCEVKVAEDLLEHLHRIASPKNKQNEVLGSAEIRRVLVGLEQIEQFARSRGLDTISEAQWTRGDDFFKGQAARPVPAGKVASIRSV
ncbi:AAA family ATPase [Candidatus Vondammii sp. HM_W22]|uniref:AAA family ATPase n=1 Tax=Candidatus Vondammii sp. HM_W22 TaxID=2687299 RepID=UPI001F1355B6|nr:ATP-binding protein [Candidatus Vondammii sp. HM_W22]